jgi:hypothetical protein
VTAGLVSGRRRRARAEAPIIKVGVLTDLSVSVLATTGVDLT